MDRSGRPELGIDTHGSEGMLEVGKIATDEGRTLHVFANPDATRPFALGVSGDRRHRPFTVALTAFELEQLLTLLGKAGRVR